MLAFVYGTDAWGTVDGVGVLAVKVLPAAVDEGRDTLEAALATDADIMEDDIIWDGPIVEALVT